MNYFINPFKQIIDFRSRATRKEYGLFFLINFLISVVYSIMVIIIGFYTLPNDITGSAGMFILLLILVMFICLLLFFVVSISLTVRRLHDINLSGWWFLIGYFPFIGNLILFVLTILPSYKEENKYGPSYNNKDGA